MGAPAYKYDEIVSETAHFVVQRLHASSYGKTVIVKSTRSLQPSRKEIAQLRHEFNVLKEIQNLDGVPRVLGLEVESHRIALILEDFGGVSLSDIIADRPLALDQFFPIAKQIVGTLVSLHQRNIVHCDLKPHNILMNQTDSQVQIIDFGSARRLVGRGQFQNEFSGATLAYIAPEQTGRVNRRVDHRTDFYTLGVSFYQLILGRLPFTGSDALEWVHAHVAKRARPLHEFTVRNIPVSLSRIVEKMMSKAAEDRYQSAEGLLYDLTEAERLFLAGELGTDFKLGQQDRSRRFMLSQSIFGRDSELQIISKNYAQAHPRPVFITGPSGSGKSSLAREYFKSLAQEDALIISTKFESSETQFPFMALARSYEPIMRSYINAPSEKRTPFVQALQKHLGQGAGVLAPLVPLLSELLGPLERPETTEDAKGRLFGAFKDFFAALNEVNSSIVVLLDDLHFIDDATAELLSYLFSQPSLKRFMLLATYRVNDSSTTPGFESLRSTIQNLNIAVLPIDLPELNSEAIGAFVADSLKMDPTSTAEIGALLTRKSGGNPLHCSQILKEWVDSELITPAPHGGWEWSIQQLTAHELPSNVVDFLASKANLLAPESRDVLLVASCIGTQFSLDSLAEITSKTEDEIKTLLQPAVSVGLLFQGEELNYQFTHEKARSIIYAMLEAPVRKRVHANLGTRLLSTLEQSDLPQEKLYSLAGHLNEGLEFFKEASQRNQIANLNLKVATLAKDSAAFDVALRFAEAGLRASSDLKWSKSHQLLFPLNLIKAQCEYITGNAEAAAQTFESIRRQTPDTHDRMRASLALLVLLQNSGRQGEAVHEGLRTLASVGIKLSPRPSTFSSVVGMFRMMAKTRGDSVGLIPMLSGTDRKAEFLRLRQEILIVTAQSAYFYDKKIFVSVILRSCEAAFTEGISGDVSVAFIFFGLFIARKFGKYREAERIGQMAMERGEGTFTRRGRALTRFSMAGFLGHWMHPWSESISKMREVNEYAQKNGDLVNSGFTALYVHAYSFYLGHDLEATEKAVKPYLEFLRETDPMLYDCALPGDRLMAQLRGETESEISFSSEDFSEEEYIKRVQTIPSPNPRAWYGVMKMFAHVIFGRFDLAKDLLPWARTGLELFPFTATVIFEHTFSAITLLELARQNGGKLEKSDRKRILASLKQVESWASLNPGQTQPFSLLLRAEWAAFENEEIEAIRCFEDATKKATECDSWMLAGITHERAARFHQRHQRNRIADVHAFEAAYAYERWGAIAKARMLRDEFKAVYSSATNTNVSASSTNSEGDLSQQLDLESIVKSTRALSSELDLETLSQKLTQVMIESAAAARGVLVLVENNELHVRSVAGSEDTSLPYTLIDHVVSSAKPLVLDDSSKATAFLADKYFAGKSPMSVLCVPIVNMNQVRGLIYLENSSSTGMFTSQRQEVLRILLGQAAVSLENARLYSEVSEKARMAGELKTAQAVQKTLFPAKNYSREGVVVLGHYEPASECGGDWWYYHESGDRLFVYIGDATGHGASAALLTSAARSAVALLSQDPELTPAKAMSMLNRAIFETSKNSMNMTFFVACLDRRTGELTYCNASHEQPFLLRKGLVDELRSQRNVKSDRDRLRFLMKSLTTMLDSNGPRLGEALDSEYEESQIQLEPGDTLILYSDGIRGIYNKKREEWGDRRLLGAMIAAFDRSTLPGDVTQHIIDSSNEFRDQAPLEDDVMLVTLRYDVRQDK